MDLSKSYNLEDRERPIRVLVLGIGNPIVEDDAIGLELLRLVSESREWPSEVEFKNGATLAMALLPYIEDAHAVLFLDAMRTGAEPGTVLQRQKDQLPGFFAKVLSAHEVGLHHVLAAAALRKSLPPYMEMVGIEVLNTRCMHPMNEVVRDALPAAVQLAVERINVLLELCAEKEGVHA